MKLKKPIPKIMCALFTLCMVIFPACVDTKSVEQLTGFQKQAVENEDEFIPPQGEFKFLFTLPTSTTLSETVIVATDSIKISDAVQTKSIVNSGDGQIEIGADATIEGNVYSVGDIFLRERATVNGSVTTDGTITVQNDGSITGDSTQLATQDFSKTFQWTIEIPEVELGNVDLEPETEQTLTPGSYGALSVKSRATLNLSAGTYYFESFATESQAVINLDEADGPVIIYVKDAFTSRATLNHSVSSGGLFIGYLGTEVVNLDGPFSGTVVAPNATVRLAPLNGGEHEGSFFVKRLEAEARTPINFKMFDHWDFIMPPTLTVECVSRAARLHRAALFSYENQLETEVTISRGTRNDISKMEKERNKGPLEFFRSGTHSKVYWLPYVGSELCWTLSGNTVCADETTRGCTKDDYKWIKNDVWEFTYKDSYPYLNTIDSTSDWIQVLEKPEEHDPVEPQEISSVPSWHFQITDWSIGTSYYDNMDMKLNFDGENQWFDMCNKPCDTCAGGCMTGRPFSSVISKELSNPTVPAAIRIYDREWNEIGDDRLLFKAVFEVNPMTQKLYYKNKEININGTAQFSDGGWDVSFSITPLNPKFCVKWDTQLAGGIGEDELSSTEKQITPASYAYVKLKISGSKEAYPDWQGYFPLDNDGCIPQKYAPNKDHLTPVDDNTDVMITLETLSKFEYSEPNAGNEKSVWRVYADGGALVKIKKTFKADNYLNYQTSILDYVIPYDNEYSKSGAIIGHLFRKQQSGVDMGIVGKDIDIYAYNSIESSPSYEPNSPYASGNEVYLRNRKYIPFSDATRKFSVGHEIGHALQYVGASRFNSTALSQYWYEDQYENGDPSNEKIPVSIPDECKCFVQKEFSPWHCMQSLEFSNAALGEGFANFYAAKAWNNPSESDCTTSYPKWMYSPDCPSGANCFDANDVKDGTHPNSFEVKKALQNEIPQDPLADWQLVMAPVPVSCSNEDTTRQAAWNKWRNNYCLDTNPSPDLKNVGTEIDWMKFYWGINTRGNSNEIWSLDNIFEIISAAATTNWQEVTFESMLEEAKQMNNISSDQRKYYEDQGDKTGVDPYK